MASINLFYLASKECPGGGHTYKLVAVVLTANFSHFCMKKNGIFNKTDLNIISEV